MAYWPSPWALAVLAILAISCQAKALQTVSGRATVRIINYSEGPSKRTLKVTLDSGAVVRADGDPRLFHGVYTGQRVRLKGYLRSSSSLDLSSAVTTMKIKAIVPLSARPKAAPQVTVVSTEALKRGGRLPAKAVLPEISYQPLKSAVRTLFVPVKAVAEDGGSCAGSNPITYTLEDLKWILTGASSSATELTLPDMYRDCSNGKTLIDVQRSRVAEWVPLPCNGTTRFGKWNIAGCENPDVDSWAALADDYLKGKGYNYSEYDSIVYIMPPSSTCGWVGMSNLGCIGNACQLWANGAFWNCPLLFLHEQGHQFSLMHAGRMVNGQYDEYADHSAAMGICCGLRCHNTPHAWQIGWQSVYQISGASLGAGETITMPLLPQSDPASRGVKIVPSWVASADPLYLGFRDQDGSDVQLGPDYAFKTNIYTAPIANQMDSRDSLYLGGIDGNSSTFWHPSTGLKFTHVGTQGEGVLISICRYAGAETHDSCCAGLDNNCDGKSGANDDTCTGMMELCPPPEDTSPDPSPSPSSVSTGSGSLYTLRQNVYTVARSCESWESKRKDAYMQAFADMSGINPTSYQCQSAGPSGQANTRVRVSIFAVTQFPTVKEARQQGASINRLVSNGSFARLVKQQTDSTLMLPRRADGWCLVGVTLCPPDVPDGAKMERP